MDYYEILAIDKSAKPEEVKSAYRAMSKKYHPDVNDAANASAFFRLIQEAYETLSDPIKRSSYDLTANRSRNFNNSYDAQYKNSSQTEGYAFTAQVNPSQEKRADFTFHTTSKEELEKLMRKATIKSSAKMKNLPLSIIIILLIILVISAWLWFSLISLGFSFNDLSFLLTIFLPILVGIMPQFFSNKLGFIKAYLLGLIMSSIIVTISCMVLENISLSFDLIKHAFVMMVILLALPCIIISILKAIIHKIKTSY